MTASRAAWASEPREPVGDSSIPLVIASPLAPVLVDTIRAVDPRLDVMYDPDLLATPRYAGDHMGVFSALADDADRSWHAMLRRAQISFDFDRREPQLARTNFPNLHWLQATSAGLGQVAPRFDLDLDRVVLTTAAGVHADPLSEFVLTALLYFVKDVPYLRARQAEHDWTRYTSGLLSGRRALIVGMGAVGRATARKLDALGVEVVGAVRPGSQPDTAHLARVIETGEIDTVVGDVDAVVLCCPLTPQTEGLISARTFAAMRADCVLVNIARGQVVDELAMIDALRAGRLGGAALDVAWAEPLPATSPLWDLDRVLISPHSASTVGEEDAAIVEIFCDNLRRWLAGRPLRNVYDPARGY